MAHSTIDSQGCGVKQVGQIELIGKNVVLKPFQNADDFIYLRGLVNKYRYNRIELTKDTPAMFQTYGRYFWIGYAEGQRGGVAYVCYFPDKGIWTLDAYRDDAFLKTLNHKGDYSYEAGKVLIPYLLENVAPEFHVGFSVDNRAARVLARRLGFREVKKFKTAFGLFVRMVIRR